MGFAVLVLMFARLGLVGPSEWWVGAASAMLTGAGATS